MVRGGGRTVATRTERIEARVAPRDRARIDKAAALEGQSISTFMGMAAAEKAAQGIAARTTTVVPAEDFDRLGSANHPPHPAPPPPPPANPPRKDPPIP